MKRKIKSKHNNAKSKAAYRRDGWYNSFNGFGGSKDVRKRTTWDMGSQLTKVDNEDKYKYSYLHRKVVDVFPEHATKSWIDLIGEKEDIELIKSELEKLKFKDKLVEAARLARLHGGAVIIVGAVDGGELYEELRIDKIQSIEYLTVLDRWQLDRHKIYDDVTDNKYGEIETYSLNPAEGKNTGLKVHESRLIRLDGVYLPPDKYRANNYWHDTCLSCVDEPIQNFITGINSGAVLTQDFIMKILKIKNIVELVAHGKLSELEDRIQTMISKLSSQSIMTIDLEEEFEKKQTPITGFVELLKALRDEVSASSGIPQAILFGQSTGTLAGATETTRSWYDQLESYREDTLTRPIDKILEMLAIINQKKLKKPEELSWDWLSLYKETDKDRAESRNKQAQTDIAYINAGVLDPLEIRASRFPRDGYSYETTLDPRFENDLTAEEVDMSEPVEGENE